MMHENNAPPKPKNRRIAKIIAFVAIPIVVTFGVVHYFFMAEGYIFIDSDPPGAQILLNDIAYPELSPTLIGPRPAGSYHVTLISPGYENWQAKITVPRSDTLWLAPVQIPLATAKSRLFLDVEPTTATLIVNQDSVPGNAPFYLNQLTPGRTEIQLIHPDYVQLDTTVFLRAGDSKMKIQMQAANGILRITSTPSGAKIRLNDHDVGKVTPATFGKVGSGLHFIELQRAGYLPSDRTIRVSAGEENVVHFNMRQRITKSVKTEEATIVLSAAIVAANNRERTTFPAIILNDRILGQAPKTLLLPQGTYTLEARLLGFENQQITFNVKPGETIKHKFIFRKNELNE